MRADKSGSRGRRARAARPVRSARERLKMLGRPASGGRPPVGAPRRCGNDQRFSDAVVPPPSRPHYELKHRRFRSVVGKSDELTVGRAELDQSLRFEDSGNRLCAAGPGCLAFPIDLGHLVDLHSIGRGFTLSQASVAEPLPHDRTVRRFRLPSGEECDKQRGGQHQEIRTAKNNSGASQDHAPDHGPGVSGSG